MKKINKFRGEYFFLSNFYITPVEFDGILYTSSESAFQSMKSRSPEIRERFATLNPYQAKKKGRNIVKRHDWDEVKEDIMYEICKAKFTQNPKLMKMLLDTGDAYLEEGNDHGDRIWGTVMGKGENKLGKILMRIRDEFKKIEKGE